MLAIPRSVHTQPERVEDRGRRGECYNGVALYLSAGKDPQQHVDIECDVEWSRRAAAPCASHNRMCLSSGRSQYQRPVFDDLRQNACTLRIAGERVVH